MLCVEHHIKMNFKKERESGGTTLFYMLCLENTTTTTTTVPFQWWWIWLLVDGLFQICLCIGLWYLYFVYIWLCAHLNHVLKWAQQESELNLKNLRKKTVMIIRMHRWWWWKCFFKILRIERETKLEPGEEVQRIETSFDSFQKSTSDQPTLKSSTPNF